MSNLRNTPCGATVTVRKVEGEGAEAMTRVICTYNPPADPSHWVNAEACAQRPGRLTKGVCIRYSIRK